MYHVECTIHDEPREIGNHTARVLVDYTSLLVLPQ